jgi:hypothetical protein
MKSIKVIFGVLVLSFVLNIAGASASDKVFFTGYEIPASRKTATISDKVKTDYSSEVIKIIGTYMNRDIQFKITDSELGATNNNYQTLSVGSSEVVYAIGSDSNTVRALSLSAIIAGTKKLELRTSGYWLGSTTSFSGSWWLSLSDWEAVNGQTSISGSNYVSQIQ